MRKPLLIGAILGLLLLAVVAAVVWLGARNAAVIAPLAAPPARPYATPQSAQTEGPLPMPQTASPAQSPELAKERRKRLAQVRAEFNALRAAGAQASPEKLQAVIDELQALSPASFDPRYFETLRSMLATNAKAQALSSELQRMGTAHTPQDKARQQAIVAELRVLGERAVAEAKNLQIYAPTVDSAAPSP